MVDIKLVQFMLSLYDRVYKLATSTKKKERKVLNCINKNCEVFTISQIAKESKVSSKIVNEVVKDLDKNGFIYNWGCHYGKLLFCISPFRVDDFRSVFNLKESE